MTFIEEGQWVEELSDVNSEAYQVKSQQIINLVTALSLLPITLILTEYSIIIEGLIYIAIFVRPMIY